MWNCICMHANSILVWETLTDNETQVYFHNLNTYIKFSIVALNIVRVNGERVVNIDQQPFI